jgi:hypothetical protein
MNTVNIKGKEYVEVKERILDLGKRKVDYEILNETTFYENQKMWVVKSTINIYSEKGDKRSFVGHAQEIIGDGYINATSALENAETSAVGRACAMAGIGVLESQTGIASANEVKKAVDRTEYNESAPKKQYAEDNRDWLTEKQLTAIILRVEAGEVGVIDKAFETYRMKKEYREKLNNLKK